MDENVTPTPPPPPEPVPPAPTPPPPPPMSRPPPIIVPPTQTSRPSKSGRGWMVFAMILLFLLLISGLYNIGTFTSTLMHGKAPHSRSVGPRLEEVLTEDNEAADKIVVIEVDGIITSRVADQGGYSLVDIIKAQLKRAEEDHRVKAVILKVDSPGGEVLASDEIYRAIADFQKDTRKPVIASMGNLAASGGYYVSAPCQWIVANDLTITGSIGVIMHSWNYRGLMDKVGLRPQTYKSGKYKDMLSGEREPEDVTDEERKMVQSLIDETYERFTNVVVTGRSKAYEKNKGNPEKSRGQRLASDWVNYVDGRVLSGTKAYELGFVDELGNFQDAVERAKMLGRIPEKANLIQYQQRYDLSDIFRIFGRSEAPVLKVDLGVEPPKLRVGQLYFLAPNFVH